MYGSGPEVGTKITHTNRMMAVKTYKDQETPKTRGVVGRLVLQSSGWRPVRLPLQARPALQALGPRVSGSCLPFFMTMYSGRISVFGESQSLYSQEEVQGETAFLPAGIHFFEF